MAKKGDKDPKQKMQELRNEIKKLNNKIKHLEQELKFYKDEKRQKTPKTKKVNVEDQELWRREFVRDFKGYLNERNKK